MNVKLDPLIQEKLRAFAQRRRRLIVIKGVLAAVAMLLLTMLIVAAIDLNWLLPDWLRWSLSGAAYLTVLVVAWRACLQKLLHAPDERQLARLIEHAEPGLREDLLSAVELGRTGGEVFDSEQFRALLQADVAHRMDGVEVKTLLPVALIRRTIGYAVMIGVAALAMMFASGWRFHTLLLRALFPGANLERVSRTKVIVREPQDGDRIVPQGDTVRVVVELAGEPSNRAKIETMSEQEGWQVMDMQPLGNDRFAATVQVGRASVRYRIKAGDALTRKYLLDARERPYVAEFQKTFHYPAYSEIAERTVTERDGGIVALEGTEVDLKVRVSQPVTKGELLIEQGKTSSTVTLNPAGDGWLAGKIALTASGSYRVHLVGAETGFENKFSPENELRAEPDLLPSVELEQPKNDLILPANEFVDIAGSASDDFGIAKVSRVVKVNDNGWKETVLVKKPGRKTRVEDRWELFEMGVKPGDLLTMKLVVTDLKGHKGESRPLQITITSSGFEIRRLQGLEALRALNESVRDLSYRAEELAKTARKTVQDVQSGNAQQALAGFTGSLTDFETKSTEAWTTFGTALRGARDGHASAELASVGRLLSRVNLDGVKLERLNVEATGAGLSPQAARSINSWMVDGCSRITQRTRLVSDAVDAMTASEESAILWENSEILMREQRRIAELAAASGDDAAKWMPVIARIRVALSQAKVIEELIDSIADRSGKRGRDWAKPAAKQLQKHREELARALKSEGRPDRRMLQRLTEFNRGVEAATANFGTRSREASVRPVAALHTLSQEAGPVYANTGRLVRDIETIGKEQAFSAEMRTALATGRWKIRGEFFKAAGDIEEIRQHADNLFVSDLRNATAALSAIHAIAPGCDLAPVRERVEDLDAALRVLESGHDLQECMDGFNHLAVTERWDVHALAARTDAPRDWRWLESRVRMIPDDLNRARPDRASDDLKAAFAGAGDILRKAQQLEAWRGLEREMTSRVRPDYQPQTSRKDAEQLAGQVKLALDLFREPMEEARRRLAKVAPSVSDLASALAKEQRDLKKQTEHHASDAAQQTAPEEKAETARHLAQQQQINRTVETLKDMIRAEANKQDILNTEQREAMRDADDALATLKDPPPKAEQALQDAAADSPEQRKADLERATEQQGKLADALQQIAKHFGAKEQGMPLDETRAALRESEKELGIKEELDQQQAHAQMLAEMAQKTPEQLLKELEGKLPENPAMQKELSAISKDALADAEQKLFSASKQEDSIAKQLETQAKQEDSKTNQAPQSAAQAARAAMDAAEAARQAAQQAEQSAKTAGNPQAEQQAAKAGSEAAKAVQQAQQAGQAAEKMANSPSPQEAAEAAQQTAQKAGEAAQAAEQAAAQAQAAANSAKDAAQKGGQPQGANQQAAQQAGDAAKQAQAAAQAARQAQAAAMAQQNPQFADAAKQQQPVAANAGEAGESTDRAGRHEARLGNQQVGAQLQQLAGAVQGTAQKQVPAAQQALAEAKMASQAQAPVNEANAQLAQELKALQGAANGQMQTQPAAGQQPQQPPGAPQMQQPATGAQSSPAEQQAMARALDALDQELNPSASAKAANEQPQQPGQQQAQSGQQQGQPGQQQAGQQPGQPSQGGKPGESKSSQSAMSQAAQAAAASMRMSRAESSATQPGSLMSGSQSDKSLGGAKAEGTALDSKALPDAQSLKRGEWGKLPRKLAEQLTKGSQEAIPGEYRQAVETYYRVLAEKAKKRP